MSSLARRQDAVDLAELRWELDRLDRQGFPAGLLWDLHARYVRAGPTDG